MKIVFYEGSFSYDWNVSITYTGLICFCHAEYDDRIKVSTISEAISTRKKENKEVVLVPFSCLGKPDTKMPFILAEKLFKRLGDAIPCSVVIPFSKENGIDLTVPPGSLVEYLEI